MPSCFLVIVHVQLGGREVFNKVCNVRYEGDWERVIYREELLVVCVVYRNY